MPAKNREVSCDFPSHVRARTNNRRAFPIPLQEVWEICSDYLYLINGEFGLQIHSFVLMPNHFHLIASDPNGRISDAMSYFMMMVSKEVGRASGSMNRLWGGRFKSSVIKSDVYLLNAYKYVYRNPVRPTMCNSALEYPYSTLPYLLGLKRGNIPLLSDPILFGDVEGVLKWIDEDFKESTFESIKRAIRRSDFHIRRDPITRAPGELMLWYELPTNLRPTIPEEAILAAMTRQK